eukprot:scaffold260837_cov36-Tisochrysis_lutea.AAC.1
MSYERINMTRLPCAILNLGPFQPTEISSLATQATSQEQHMDRTKGNIVVLHDSHAHEYTNTVTAKGGKSTGSGKGRGRIPSKIRV